MVVCCGGEDLQGRVIILAIIVIVKWLFARFYFMTILCYAMTNSFACHLYTSGYEFYIYSILTLTQITVNPTKVNQQKQRIIMYTETVTPIFYDCKLIDQIQ